MAETLILVLVIATALAFDFTNGFHDTANAMAASVASGALRPRVAVGLSATLNVVGAFLSLSVAATIAKGIVEASSITMSVVLAGLIGAVLWNLFTWLLGLPSSSSHALIGGVIGATMIAAGTDAVIVGGLLKKVMAPAVLAPVVAITVATLVVALVIRLTARYSDAARDRVLKGGQVCSASLVSLAHGTNDAQKTMGIITLALITHGALPAGGTTPVWVIVSCALVMGLGTAMGGWRIMRTLGRGITDLGPTQGFSSDLTSSSVILVSSHFGFPLSTTQVVTGAVMGTGVGTRAAGRTAPLRWSVAGRMASAWLITLPAAGLVGAASWLLANLIGGATGCVTIVAIAVAAAAFIWWLSRRNRVSADNVTAEWTGSLEPAGAAPATGVAAPAGVATAPAGVAAATPVAVPVADLAPVATLTPVMMPAVELATGGPLGGGSDSRPIAV